MIANVALPSFLPHSFATLMGIFVIAGIEGWFVMRVLRLSYADSYRHALNANWKSTIAGIPFAWLLWTIGTIPISMGLSAIGLKAHPFVSTGAIQTVFFGGLMPTETFYISNAAASIVMLIPFWMGSVWIERRTLAKRLPDYDFKQISKAVVRGNFASYSIFLILGTMSLATAIADLPNQKELFEKLRERLESAKQKLDEDDPDQAAPKSR
jgi:hypothetical protein